MSRIMHQLAPAAFADNTLHDVVTVPADHKFEVVEGWIQLLGAAGSVPVIYSHTPAGYLFAEYRGAVAAGTYLWRASWQALVLNAGDSLAMAAYGVGGSWSMYATYIDVFPV